MSKKIIFSLMFLFLISPSYADSFLPDGIEKVLVSLFQSFPESMRSGDVVAIAFFKFLLWILVFATIYFSLKKVFSYEGGHKSATAIAIIISLGGVILIPNNVVTIIFELYAGVAALIVIGLPLFLVWYFTRTVFGKGHGWMKGVSFIIAAAIIELLAVWLLEATRGYGLYGDVSKWMEIAATILLFLGMISFFEGNGSHGGHSDSHGFDEDYAKKKEEHYKESEIKEEKDIENNIKLLKGAGKKDLNIFEHLVDYLEKLIAQLQRLLQYVKAHPEAKPQISGYLKKYYELIANTIRGYERQHAAILADEEKKFQDIIAKLKNVKNLTGKEEGEYMGILSKLKQEHDMQDFAVEEKHLEAEKYAEKLEKYAQALATQMEKTLERVKKSGYLREFNDLIESALSKLKNIINDAIEPETGLDQAIELFKKAWNFKRREFQLMQYVNKLEAQMEKVEKIIEEIEKK